MSSDKYAQYLIQKYRLAVAIAVIQTTPETKSLDEHLLDLRNKFNVEKMDDLDITICSDDFDVDFNENDFNDTIFHDNCASQNSDTILKEFNDVEIPVDENMHQDVSADVMDIVQNLSNEEKQDQNNENDLQSTFCETQTQLDVYLAPGSLTDVDKTFCDSIARIRQDNIMDIDRTCDNIAKIYKTHTATTKTSKELEDKNTTKENTVKINQGTITSKKINENIKNADHAISRQYLEGTTALDSQATEVYTLHCLTENDTHVSQSQHDNFGISHIYIKGINKTNSKSKNEDVDMPVPINTDFNRHLKDVNLVGKIKRNLEKDNKVVQIETFNNQNTQTATEYRENEDQINQTQVPYLVTADSENLLPQHKKDENLVRKIRNNLEHDNAIKHINKDQFTNIQSNENAVKDCTINDNNLQETQGFYAPVYNNQQNSSQDRFDNNLAQNIKINENTLKDFTINDNNLQNTPVFHDCVNNAQLLQERVNNDIQNTDQLETNTQNTLHELSRTDENITMQAFNFSPNDKETSHNTDLKKDINDVENDSDSSEETSQVELVPFKVMEELNRVKAFLNKRVERRMSNESSLDSGYRSDSQGRSSQGRSRSGFQLSGNWVGQSGFCLYDHLTRCPLVDTTEEIVGEISEVLGQLIDKLHDEESYPSFLEELLDYVESLIRCIFTEEDMVLEKDEKIQRLLLLNKSVHIQKYSIEKLTNILEDMHARLTDKHELYELTNVQEIENLSYIFHILEIILKRYLKNKKIDIQIQSQETDRYPKRSSISDIWRKKWNPNYKEEIKIDSSSERKCVFKKCNEVLNRIVVGCMDGYSLVAFAALQCFNLLQS